MKTSVRILVSLTLFVTGVSFAYAQSTCTVTVTASDTTLCMGDCATLNALFSPSCSNVSYSWSPSSSLNDPNISNPVACPFSSTTYTVVACCNATSCCDTATVTVFVNPVIWNPISGTDSICLGQSATLCYDGGVSYAWMPGGQTTWCITVSPTTTTTYTAIATSGNCTNSETHTLFVNTCTGIIENTFSNQIDIYPNPFLHTATIHINDAQLIPSEFKIYDLLGKEVKSFQIKNTETKIVRDNLSSGLYYYRLLHKGQIIDSGKMLIE